MKIVEENCIGCGQCSDFCDAISLVATQGYATMKHNKDICAECGRCVEEIDCPGEVFHD